MSTKSTKPVRRVSLPGAPKQNTQNYINVNSTGKRRQGWRYTLSKHVWEIIIGVLATVLGGLILAWLLKTPASPPGVTPHVAQVPSSAPFILRRTITQTTRVGSLAFSPDNVTLAAGTDDEKVYLWHIATGAKLGVLEKESQSAEKSAYMLSVAYSPSGAFLAAGSNDNKVRIWQLSDHKLLQTFEGHKDAVETVAFSPDGKVLASGSDDKTIRLWDMEKMVFKRELTGHNGPVHSLAFSPDGVTLASGASGDSVWLWNTKDGTHRKLEGQRPCEGYVSQVAFSPDGETIASGLCGKDEKTVQIWNIIEGSRYLLKAQSDTKGVVFHGDNKTLITVSGPKISPKLRLWQLPTTIPKYITDVSAEQDTTTTDFRAVAYNSHEYMLALSYNGGAIQLWELTLLP